MIISEKNGWVLAQILGSNYVLIILTLFNSLSTLAKEMREDKIIPVYSQPVLHHALRDHRKFGNLTSFHIYMSLLRLMSKNCDAK